MNVPAPYFDVFQPGHEDGWVKVDGNMIFESPHIDVQKAHYLTPSRKEEPVPWYVVHRKVAVAIAPVLEDGRFVLIAQERLPVQQTCWEFPAGQIDVALDPTGPDGVAVVQQQIVDTALREMREESGCELHPEHGSIEPLGWFFPSQGFTDEHVYLFKAEPVCVVSRPEPDGSEHISAVRLVSAGELRRMIAENEITTALTLALYARMAAMGLI
jgi:8-oxo-dGTP pyrophosphatase MutT (NUDIX family)